MRKIIVQNNEVNKDGSNTVNCVFWLSVPAKVKKPAVGTTSQVSDASPAELVALQDGSIVEKAMSITVNTITDARVILPRMYQDEQKNITDQGTKTDYAGFYWDGAKWNAPA